MAKVISIINHKGGVGKTTVTANLGAALALSGKKILLIDFDPQANLSDHFGIEEDNEGDVSAVIMHAHEPIPHQYVASNFSLDIIPGNLELSLAEKEFAGRISGFSKCKQLIAHFEANYDYILIDCPPSLGFLTLNALNASSHVLIPAEASKFSIKGLHTIQNLVEEVRQEGNPNLKLIGIVINNMRNLRVSKQISEYLNESHLTLNTQIRNYKHYIESAAMSHTIFEHGEAKAPQQDFLDLVQEIQNEEVHA
ncbi:ParA family protein [Aureibacter tunicatorum]|uniref:Chromosome partitioning protein n=1 Tax=Aureibacter tunicatorum TaxID=866807 RepID=A0AAE4BVR0_9BACT|nr:ParA family protein [Aureibacter tunicatorum]MDR6241948.1 chromosome partitioning protein [Aureibacter tunicatorum]BDD07501.1 sporulation initiation inhibitor protein Soj [Aureibacter tunicatorum]